MRRIRIFVAMVSAFLLALPLWAQDSVKVDPKRYKVEFQVRVLRISFDAKEKSVMHDHPANAAVFLTDGHAKFTLPDGKTQEGHSKTGQVEWDAGGKHLPENIGDKPFELILVELKSKGTESASPVGSSEDPAKVAQRHCKVELENDQVRVLRWKIGPAEKTAMHRHPANVTVLLTGGRARFYLADGTTRETDEKAGQVVWSNGEKHAQRKPGRPDHRSRPDRAKEVAEDNEVN